MKTRPPSATRIAYPPWRKLGDAGAGMNNAVSGQEPAR
jgi:hypothetical protein